jgi:hypothetical protein
MRLSEQTQIRCWLGQLKLAIETRQTLYEGASPERVGLAVVERLRRLRSNLPTFVTYA